MSNFVIFLKTHVARRPFRIFNELSSAASFVSIMTLVSWNFGPLACRIIIYLIIFLRGPSTVRRVDFTRGKRWLGNFPIIHLRRSPSAGLFQCFEFEIFSFVIHLTLGILVHSCASPSRSCGILSASVLYVE